MSVALSPRQQQLYDMLAAWQRSATAAELSRAMKARYGVSYPVYDMLGALRKKGYVEFVSDNEWQVVS